MLGALEPPVSIMTPQPAIGASAAFMPETAPTWAVASASAVTLATPTMPARYVWNGTLAWTWIPATTPLGMVLCAVPEQLVGNVMLPWNETPSRPTKLAVGVGVTPKALLFAYLQISPAIVSS